MTVFFETILGFSYGLFAYEKSIRDFFVLLVCLVYLLLLLLLSNESLLCLDVPEPHL